MKHCESLPPLTRTVGRELELLIEQTEPSSYNVGFARGYAARIRALSLAAASLCESDGHDAIPMLYRTLFETWLHGVYLCVGGDEALERLNQQKNLEWSRLDLAFGRHTSPVPRRKLTVKELAELLDGHIAEIEPSSNGWSLKAYDSQYRTTSFHDVHGHLGALALNMDEDGTVHLHRELGPAHHCLAMVISLGLGFAVAFNRLVNSDPPESYQDILNGLRSAYPPS